MKKEAEITIKKKAKICIEIPAFMVVVKIYKKTFKCPQLSQLIFKHSPLLQPPPLHVLITCLRNGFFFVNSSSSCQLHWFSSWLCNFLSFIDQEVVPIEYMKWCLFMAYHCGGRVSLVETLHFILGNWSLTCQGHYASAVSQPVHLNLIYGFYIWYCPLNWVCTKFYLLFLFCALEYQLYINKNWTLVLKVGMLTQLKGLKENEYFMTILMKD